MPIDRVVPALLVAIGVAVAGWTVSQGLERFRMSDRTITVKGLAEREVESDFVVWTLTFRRAGNVFGEVQKALAADREQVAAFLREAGIEDAEVELRPLQVIDVYSREYSQPNQPMRFTGSGQVLVKSARVAEVSRAALAIDPLIQAGLVIEGETARATSCAASTRRRRRCWPKRRATHASRRRNSPRKPAPRWGA